MIGFLLGMAVAFAANEQISASLTLRVPDRQAALDAAVAAAEGAGGWFSALSDSGATLRVPAARTEAILETLRGLGDPVERSFESTDRGAELDELRTRLKTRQGLLARYEEVLETASPEAVVSVERAMTQVVGEIEGLQGRIRLLEDRVAYSEISASFQYRERAAPRRDGTSSFDWLNTVNLADLLYDLQAGARGSKSRVSAEAPDGFAPYDKRGRFQAVAPDGCAFRVRSARNKPVADLDFWAEALRTRMVDAGYHLEQEQRVQAGGMEVAVLELGAANGERDQTYVVGLAVQGRRLVIVEATGEAEVFAGRRGAVMAAIGKLGG